MDPHKPQLISEQERLLALLDESQALYHSLVEGLPQNFFRKDLQGRFTFANSRFCQMLGRPLQEIIGKTDSDFYPPDLAAKYQRDDRTVLETGQTFETTEEHLRAGTDKRFVQVVKTPVRDASNAIVGVQGIFWDVTERKRIEAELARERELLRALLENIPDAIYFKDRQSRFLLINNALARKLGLENPDHAIGKTDFDFFHPTHAEQAFQDEQAILHSGSPIIGKTEKESWPDGRQLWVLTTKVPLRNPAGHVIGTFGISKEITELRRIQEELAQARDAALESARLKSEFLANMSHELRTPMNAIIGMSGLLLDTPMSEEQRDFAETIRASADVLLTLINDILDFSKIEAGKLAIEVIDFALSDVVERTVELLAEEAQAKNLELVSWVQPDVPLYLRGDPSRLRQILTNLLSNAVKFTQRGEAVVNVAKETEDDHHVTLRFSVRDTGIGIPPSAHDRLSQAFTQADGSFTRRYGGSGLGLAICRQLVDLMRGQIGFESAPGAGSTFWFTVPLEKQTLITLPTLETKADLTGVRVLIVDDNQTNRQILHHQVLSWKMRNGTASSGPQALNLLHQAGAAGDPYELAILDMQMPEMDGLTLAHTIHADPSLQQTRIVMLTSLGHHVDFATLKTAGIAAFLIKPVKQSRLYDCLTTILSAAQTTAPTPASAAQTPPATNRKSLRVLVAEDNAVNQKVALRQLQKLGYAADAVANGLEVLRALACVQYDLILMDCHMPEMDGYQATRHIRQNEATLPKTNRTQYIIAMTANALAGDREECLAAGMNDYISKPVRLDELNLVLDRAADRLRQTRPFSSPLSSPSLPPNPPALNLARLENLRALRLEGEPDPLAELIDLFLKDSPDQLQRIRAGFHSGNLTEIEHGAHSLKGSAANLGAENLTNLCAQIVALTRRRSTDGLTHLVAALEPEFARVRRALEQFLSDCRQDKQFNRNKF